MVMFVASKQSHAIEGVQAATIDEVRAAAANQLLGICLAIDPEGHRDLDGLVQTLWRVPSRDLPGIDAVTLESLQGALERQHELLVRYLPSSISLDLPGPTPQPRADEAPAAAIVPPPVSADLVRHMVDRFLTWKLPDGFAPDGGIKFTPVMNEGTPYAYASDPSGTNLFNAQQAETMVRHMLEGAPPVSKGEAAYAQWRASIDTEFDGTKEDLARARDMFEKWIGDALPASDGGQVHFGRALAESMADAIEAYLKGQAEAPPVSAEIEDVDRLLGWAVYMRDESDDVIIRNYYEDKRTPSYGALMLGDVRALMRAAGLFTDDMRPSQPVTPVGAADASVRPADGDAAPPPAVADDFVLRTAEGHGEEEPCVHCGVQTFGVHDPKCPTQQDPL